MENVKNVNMIMIIMVDIATFAQKMGKIIIHVLAGKGILKLKIMNVLDVMMDVQDELYSRKK